MKILLTGSTGFLGRFVLELFASKGIEIQGVARNISFQDSNKQFQTQLDLANFDKVDHYFRDFQPDVVIHNAAMSKPDFCAQFPREAWQQNVEVTRYLVEKTSPSAHFIYISSDFVLGDQGPHNEQADYNPLNYYGVTKQAAELYVNERVGLSTIVRPVFIYGPQLPGSRGSFIQWVATQLNSGNSIKVVNDQWRTPTFAPDIAQALFEIVAKKVSGLFHIAGSDLITPYQMAVEVANYLQLNAGLIHAVDELTFPEPVKRAKRGGLKNDKAIEELNFVPTALRDALTLCF
ncbi:MAG: SDR family oxidoreductase [Hydrotalea sp.]|nr:SDR family oxidoreductase [Hydrotalea sp.]